jgi:hypothetical protein
VAIPLAIISNERVTNLYDVMDSAYDVPQIHDMSRQLGHIPLIDVHPRRDKGLKDELTAEKKRCRLIGHKIAEAIRYNERSTVERVNARLKDEFGGRVVAGARSCKGDVSFDVWPAGLNSQSDDDFSDLKTISNGYSTVIYG